MANIRTSKKLTVSVTLILLLVVALGLTTYALVQALLTSEVTVTTGTISVAMGADEASAAAGSDTAILDGTSFLMEPGATQKADLVVKNTGTEDAYYRIYLQNIGEFVALAEHTTVTVKAGNEELYSGPMTGLTRSAAKASGTALAGGESATVSLYFHLPADVGNSVQNATVTFDLCAEAVQAKNNDGMQFDFAESGNGEG